MKIVIATVGSLGDVAPYTGLAARLLAAGHRVAIAAQAPYADIVRACGAEFRVMPGDVHTLLRSPAGQRMQANGTGLRGIVANARLGREVMDQVGEGLPDAAKDADVLLTQRSTMIHGYLLATAMGIPTMVLELWPGVPTGEFMLPLLGGRSLGRWANRSLPRLVFQLPNPLDGSIKQFQRLLGLPTTGFGQPQRDLLADRNVLLYHGFSEVIAPTPADWREGAEVVGYWWPERPADWQPSAELADFLDAGPAPVYIGFGSMSPGDARHLSGIVSAALRRAGIRRVVVQTGKPGLEINGDEVLSIGNVPHEWLFPQMAAVVHHGGAGTTGAGLRAGVPAVPVPVLIDHPFWALRLEALGVSPGWVPFKHLSAVRLGDLIRRSVSESSYQERAAALADRVRAEDGAGRVVEAIAHLDGAKNGRLSSH